MRLLMAYGIVRVGCVECVRTHNHCVPPNLPQHWIGQRVCFPENWELDSVIILQVDIVFLSYI